MAPEFPVLTISGIAIESKVSSMGQHWAKDGLLPPCNSATKSLSASERGEITAFVDHDRSIDGEFRIESNDELPIETN